MPEPLRGNKINKSKIRHLPIQNNSNDDKTSIEIQSNRDIIPVSIDNLPETEIVHLGQRSKDEYSLFIQTGKRTHKALWDSGACKSLESYNMIPDKYKTDLFPSSIKIKAANGTVIDNSGECDITFGMGTQRLTFPFLCSSQLPQQVIIGHYFCNTFNIGTIWSATDVMSLTYQGKPIAQCIRTKGINALVFCAESIVIKC